MRTPITTPTITAKNDTMYVVPKPSVKYLHRSSVMKLAINLALKSSIFYMLSNLLLFFYDNDLTCSRIGISKINAQLTLFRYSHARSAEICLAGNDCVDDRVKFHIFNL